MAGVPNDPDRIDISLDLVGGQSLAAIQALTDQLSTVGTYLANVQAETPEGRAANAANIGRAVNTTGKIARSGEHGYSSRPPTDPVADGAGKLASDPETLRYGTQPLYRRMLNSGGPRNFLQREIALYGAQERDQVVTRSRRGYGGLDPSYAPLFGEEHLGGADLEMSQRPGSVSSGASNPNVARSNDPLWRQSLMSNPVDWERAKEGFRLPPGGLSLNPQQKLEIAADFFTRSAERRYQATLLERQQQALSEAQQTAMLSGAPASAVDSLRLEDMDVDMSGVSSRSGTIAAGLRLASNQSGIMALGSDLRQQAARFYNYAGAIQATGVQAGGERAGQITIPGTNIGITNPFDFFNRNSAAREGLRQRVNVQRLRLMGGINGTQANQIVTGLAGSGWTGGQGQDIAFDGIAPLVQQGMNPELAVNSFDQTMRQGNASLSDFVDTMSNLQESAHAARMSLDEYQQGLSQFSEVAQGLGATGVQGTRLGRGMTDALGVAPQVAAEMIQSPLVQGMALRQGLLPNETGLMSPTEGVQNVYTALDMAMKATAGFRNQPVKDAAGHVIASGEQRQIAQVASILGPGFSTDVVQRLLRQRNFSQAAARAEPQIERLGGMEKALGQTTEGKSTAASPYTSSAGRGGSVSSAMRGGELLTSLEQKRLSSANTQIDHQWRSVLHTLREGAPDEQDHPGQYRKYMAEVGQLSHTGRGDRMKAAEHFIRTHSQSTAPDTTPTVHVKFTGAAAKFFEQNPDELKKMTANAGGQSLQAQLADLPTRRDKQAYVQDMLKNATGGVIGG